MDNKVGSEHRRQLLAYNMGALMHILDSLDEPGQMGIIVDVDDGVGREMIVSLIGPKVIEEHRARTSSDFSPTVLTHLPAVVVKQWLRDNGYQTTLSEWRETGTLKVLIIGAGGVTLAQIRNGQA